MFVRAKKNYFFMRTQVKDMERESSCYTQKLSRNMLRIFKFIQKIKETEETKRKKRACPIETMKESLGLKRLLNHPEIRATMTTGELYYENNSDLCSQGCNDGNSKLIQEDIPNVSKVFLPERQTESSVNLNFNKRFSATFLERVARHSDLRHERERALK